MIGTDNFERVSARIELYRRIRQYFADTDVFEVEVPVLGTAGTTEPQIQSFEVPVGQSARYLQTSPEFFLKRLLAEMPRSIFTIAKVFRDEEFGRNHNPEFSMLEWYRIGFDLDSIITDSLDVVTACLGNLPVHRETYQSIFIKHLQINPHETSLDQLQQLVERHTSYPHSCISVDEALQLLLSIVIEPKFESGITVLSEFPAGQAALARLDANEDGYLVAKRFELYCGSLELANGYQELTDAAEQKRRFEQDNLERKKIGKRSVSPDLALINALQKGLPDCAGVSIGLDRLLMVKMGVDKIGDVLLFPWQIS